MTAPDNTTMVDDRGHRLPRRTPCDCGHRRSAHDGGIGICDDCGCVRFHAAQVLDTSLPPWIVVPCSGAKAPGDHLPAKQRYTGSLHRAAMATALRIAPARHVLIASARYGLLDLDQDTEPYDRRLEDLSADDARQWRGWVQCDACSLWGDGRYSVRTADGLALRDGRPGAPVILFTPRFYTEQLLTAPFIARYAIQPFFGCRGIGDMRHVLSTFTWPLAAGGERWEVRAWEWHGDEGWGTWDVAESRWVGSWQQSRQAAEQTATMLNAAPPLDTEIVPDTRDPRVPR